MICFINKKDLACVIPSYRHVTIECKAGYLIIDINTYALIAKETATMLNEQHLFDSVLNNDANLLKNYKRLSAQVEDHNLMSLWGIIGFIKLDLSDIDVVDTINILLAVIRDQPINTLYKKKAQLTRKIDTPLLMMDDIALYVNSVKTTINQFQQETIERLATELIKEEHIRLIADRVATMMPQVAMPIQATATTSISHNPETSVVEVVTNTPQPSTDAKPASTPATPLAVGEISEDAFADMDFSFKLPKKKKKPRVEPVLEQKTTVSEATEEQAELSELIDGFI